MLNLKISKELKKEYQYIEDVLVGNGAHFLYCINTPIKDLKEDYKDKIGEIPELTKGKLAELVLMNGLRNDWGFEIYGMKMCYDLIVQLKDMWVESVMREYYLKYGTTTATGEKTTIKEALNNVKALYALATISKVDRAGITTIMKQPAFISGLVEGVTSYGAYRGAAQAALVAGTAVATARSVSTVAAPLALAGSTVAVAGEAGAVTAVSAGAGAAAGVGAVGASVLLGPATLFIGSLLAAAGIQSLIKLLHVLAVLDKSRTPNFDPNQSVYGTWGKGESLVNSAASIIAENSERPEVKEFLAAETSHLTGEERDELNKQMEEVAATRTAVVAYEEVAVASGHTDSGAPRHIISAEVDEEDTLK